MKEVFNTMTTTKITIAEQYSAVINFLKENGATEEMVNFIADRKALHEKKNGNRKPTKTQEANIGLMADIVGYMTEAKKPVTISEIIKNVASCNNLSTPKVSALVTKMKNAGEVTRTEIKGKAYFSLI